MSQNQLKITSNGHTQFNSVRNHWSLLSIKEFLNLQQNVCNGILAIAKLFQPINTNKTLNVFTKEVRFDQLLMELHWISGLSLIKKPCKYAIRQFITKATFCTITLREGSSLAAKVWTPLRIFCGVLALQKVVLKREKFPKMREIMNPINRWIYADWV